MNSLMLFLHTFLSCVLYFKIGTERKVMLGQKIKMGQVECGGHSCNPERQKQEGGWTSDASLSHSVGTRPACSTGDPVSRSQINQLIKEKSGSTKERSIVIPICTALLLPEE